MEPKRRVGDSEVGTGAEGWTKEESKVVLRQLYEHATREENVYRHKWKKGDLVCWDNRCTMHKGPPTHLFPPKVMRDMVRTNVTPAVEIRPQAASSGGSRL